MSKLDVVVIGGGIAGLSAAIHLQNEGLKVKLVEKSDRVGGRMKTDRVDGFLLDRGFQVLLTSYPEARKLLDYNSLQLKNFYPGALILKNNKLHRLADPFRKPLGAIGALFSPISNSADKLKILALRNRHNRLSISDIFQQPEQSTLDFLREWHFSPTIIESFFKPFLGGVFLDPELKTSSRMFEFIFKMFSSGYAALPAEGMEAIPKQLASRLQKDTIITNNEVVKISKTKVKLKSGDTLSTRSVLIATDSPSIKKLIPSSKVEFDNIGQSVKCLYFMAAQSPIAKPLLILNGNSTGLINNVCIPSIVNPSYAPPGRHLISVTILQDQPQFTDEELIDRVKIELLTWFKNDVRSWNHLKTYSIPYALPTMPRIPYQKKGKIEPIAPGIFVCGDHMGNASINGALQSARETAESLSWDLALNN